MNIKLLVLFNIAIVYNSIAQAGFQIRNSNPVFGFDISVPATKKMDTLGVILYTAKSLDSTEYFAQFVGSDSSFVSTMNFGISQADSANYLSPSDSLANPLFMNREMFKYIHDSTTELYYTEIEQTDTNVKCAEMGFSYKEGMMIEKNLYARVYYNGHDIYTFILIGLKRRETDLTTEKNNYFNSIFIN